MEPFKELVAYPCGHDRRVIVGRRGWNYCPTCHESYPVTVLNFGDPKHPVLADNHLSWRLGAPLAKLTAGDQVDTDW